MADEDQKKPKRRVRKVESVRDISTKSEQPATVGTGRKIGRGFTAPVRFIGRGIAGVGHKLNKIKVFRILGLILWPPYFRNSWKELRQVTWPNGKQSRQLTTAVILFAVTFGIIIALLDFGLDKIFKQVLLK
ncbi:MAG TPA: preprotein translocase subunit SecE [Candidatus Saccharimonadales bacterium]|nr:preprotein translocase subunit SecE [Candidatus Saccharimonadales bacterium]